MKNSLQTLYRNRHFLLFILLFAYIQSVYSRISARRFVDVYAFTPEAALATVMGTGLLFLIILFFIRKWQHSDAISTKIILKIFGASLLTYIISARIIGLLIAISFGKVEQNFNQYTFTLNLFSDLLQGIIYGSFSLAYYYFHKNRQYQQNLASYHQALAESKINQLKTQLNPHFLFNNLNILDQLIEEDKQVASDFLNEFAEIYRYVLQASDKELVNLKQEVDLAQQYFNLIQYKYGNAYQLSISPAPGEGTIVPLTLQLLIENAVQHNLGTTAHPVHIQIRIENAIFVSNTLNLKRSDKPTSGRALKNLQTQYNLLTQSSLQIQQTEREFSVTIPIIPL